MTGTAAMADIVPPATTFLEHDDIYRAKRSHPSAGDAQGCRAPTQAKPNHFVDLRAGQAPRRRTAGSSMSEWEIIDETLESPAGWPAGSMPITGWTVPWISKAGIFSTASAIRTAGSASSRNGREWARHRRPAADAGFRADHRCRRRGASVPPGGGAGPAVLNTTFTETSSSQKREQRPTLLIHPADAARLGSTTAARSRSAIGRRRSSCTPGCSTACCPGGGDESIWPNAAFGGGLRRQCADQRRSRLPNGGARLFHDTAV